MVEHKFFRVSHEQIGTEHEVEVERALGIEPHRNEGRSFYRYEVAQVDFMGRQALIWLVQRASLGGEPKFNGSVKVMVFTPEMHCGATGLYLYDCDAEYEARTVAYQRLAERDFGAKRTDAWYDAFEAELKAEAGRMFEAWWNERSAEIQKMAKVGQ